MTDVKSGAERVRKITAVACFSKVCLFFGGDDVWSPRPLMFGFLNLIILMLLSEQSYLRTCKKCEDSRLLGSIAQQKEKQQ